MSRFDEFSDLAPIVADETECTMSLDEIQREIEALYELAHRGFDIDERRFDFLLKAQAEHPEYAAMVTAEKEHWRESVAEFVQECLERTRTFVPVDIFHSSHDDLVKLGLSSECARRILSRHCLWLTRMSRNEIARLHEYDLISRYNALQQSLDIIETAAVYAALPEVFRNDKMGKKGDWRNSVEDALRQMLLDNDEDKLPANRIRNPVYEGLQFGPVKDVKSVRHNDVVSSEDSFKPRRSFTEVCRQHSLVNRLNKPSPGSSRSIHDESPVMEEPEEDSSRSSGEVGNDQQQSELVGEHANEEGEEANESAEMAAQLAAQQSANDDYYGRFG